MQKGPALNHRNDIDGLRAIAIIGVLLFHLKESWLPGGFLGVDVFFVISGYLITSIIRRDILEQRFSFAQFYERRIRRIMPAFFVVMLATAVAASFLMLPDELMAFGKSLQFALLSIGNFHFLETTQDYFANQAASQPLLHTWSLGVEEQFYLFFPFLLLGLKRFKSPPTAILVLLVLSFAGCLIYARIDASACFFLLPYRAWQMLLGALLAIQAIPQLPKAGAKPAGLLGLALIIGSMILVTSEGFAPGLSALPACLGTALIILAGTHADSPASRMLSWKPFAGIGLISYSVYLWHWPLIVLTKAKLGEVSPLILGALGFASLLLGWASWKWIENPVRRPHFLTRRKVFILWAVITAVFIGGTVFIKKTKGLEFRYASDVRAMLAWKTNRPSYPNNVKKHWDVKRTPIVGDKTQTPSIALWGDSHADALLPWLDAAATKDKRAVRVFTVAAQTPVPGVVVDKNYNAERLRYTKAVLDEILATPALSTVILHARWSYSLYGYNEESVAQNIKFFNHHELDETGRERFYADHLHDVVAKLIAAGKTVVLVYPVPEVGVSVPDLLARQLIRKEQLATDYPLPGFRDRQRAIIAALDSIPDNLNLRRIRLYERLLHGDRLTIQAGGLPLYFDDDHLSLAGLNYVKDLLDSALEPVAAK